MSARRAERRRWADAEASAREAVAPLAGESWNLRYVGAYHAVRRALVGDGRLIGQDAMVADRIARRVAGPPPTKEQR